MPQNDKKKRPAFLAITRKTGLILLVGVARFEFGVLCYSALFHVLICLILLDFQSPISIYVLSYFCWIHCVKGKVKGKKWVVKCNAFDRKVSPLYRGVGLHFNCASKCFSILE